METSDYYALGIPLFLALMLGEAWLSWRRGRNVYDTADTISNLGCGLGQLIFGMFSGPVILALYTWFQGRFALVAWPEGSAWPWVIALVGVDFCYYWFHRLGHQIGLLWAVHAVHHQSEEYNYSVGLRQTWFSDWTAVLFYWPLPLIGVKVVPFFAAVAVLSLYQLSLHTELFGSYGRIGWIFNTPSHHRVHHATNARYRDKNFGATLIVWDRLFGTFEPEVERPAYGMTPRLATHNPVTAQIVPARELLARVRAAPTLRAKLEVGFGRSANAPADARALASPVRPRPRASSLAVALAVLTAASALPLLALGEGRSAAENAPWALAVVAAAFAVGVMLDRAPLDGENGLGRRRPPWFDRRTWATRIARSSFADARSSSRRRSPG